MTKKENIVTAKCKRCHVVIRYGVLSPITYCEQCIEETRYVELTRPSGIMM